jgi:cytosine/adenosine deaminase-related metal-dependent hydrolase
VVLIKNDRSPAMFPILNPYGHVAFQAQRGDVHTVLVNGRVVKHLGDEAWQQGMNPEIPATKVLDNPYTYTDFRSADTHSAR